jgi:hypothetical protein
MISDKLLGAAIDKEVKQEREGIGTLREVSSPTPKEPVAQIHGASEMTSQLLEENVALKKLLSSYDAENHGSTSWQNSYNEFTAMNTKIEVVESELMKMQTTVDRLSYELSVSNARLAEERDAKKHIEQYYREKLNQYVAYFESKHSEKDRTDPGESILTIDDFLRLTEEREGLVEPDMEPAATRPQQQTSPQTHKGRIPGQDASPTGDNMKRRSRQRRSSSPSYRSLSIFRNTTKSAAEELSAHKEYERSVMEAKKRSCKKIVKGGANEDRPILSGPTTSLVVQTPTTSVGGRNHDPIMTKLRATHKAGVGDGKPMAEVKIPRNIIESPPSLKQRQQTSAEDDGFSEGKNGSGGTRNCALNQPPFGTVFLHRDHAMENIGEGDHTNDDLTEQYAEMGSWAKFTSSSKAKLRRPMSPMIGTRGKDAGLFKFT